jgi:hypothetical protein
VPKVVTSTAAMEFQNAVNHWEMGFKKFFREQREIEAKDDDKPKEIAATIITSPPTTVTIEVVHDEATRTDDINVDNVKAINDPNGHADGANTNTIIDVPAVTNNFQAATIVNKGTIDINKGGAPATRPVTPSTPSMSSLLSLGTTSLEINPIPMASMSPVVDSSKEIAAITNIDKAPLLGAPSPQAITPARPTATINKTFNTNTASSPMATPQKILPKTLFPTMPTLLVTPPAPPSSSPPAPLPAPPARPVLPMNNKDAINDNASDLNNSAIVNSSVNDTKTAAPTTDGITTLTTWPADVSLHGMATTTIQARLDLEAVINNPVMRKQQARIVANKRYL